jgi:iron complex outermembrane receptor protein
MRLLTTIFGALLLIGSAAGAQQLTGTVVDSEGQPIIGVSVITNITGKGTASDEQGRFALVLTDEVTRVTFSAVGFHLRQFRPGEVPETVVLDLAYYRGMDIVVSAGRAESGVTPIAFDNLSEDDIKRDYTVGEFPLLLETTPNLYSYSDAGTPLGYSYMKIRGFDDKRLATYINGVPLNDPEDQATYFVDLPDFAANATDVQVQRGVGNSLYGDASFGGSINIATNPFGEERKVTLTSGYGEYTSGGASVSDIYKQSLEYYSGLIDGQWLLSGRYSKQKTGGYRENSWYEGWAYYFSVARVDPNMMTQLHVYGGPMRMHLAYYGVSRDDLERNRFYNPLEYGNETDNFNQPHYQLTSTFSINDRTTLTNTLYYIRGKGYYEQYKDDRSYREYDLLAYSDSTRGNIVRQQWVEKNQYGWNPMLDIEHDRGSHTIGGSFYYFESDHWGQVVWAENVKADLDPRHRYYQYFGKKYVGSFYGREFFELTDRLSTQVTAQFRYQRYDFDQVRMGAFAGHDYDVDWFFFSPRMGLNYQIGGRFSLFANFAVSSRTPTDAEVYDANDPDVLPSLEILSTDSTSVPGRTIYEFGDLTAKCERVYDIELGGQYRSDILALGGNLFWMDFKDEIIPYGGISDDGIPITVNAERSVHSGVELTGALKAREWLEVSGNFAYNYNRVKKHLTELDGYAVDFSNQIIPGFPEHLGNLIADINSRGLRVVGKLRIVGRQHMELLNLDSLSIEPYSVVSLAASYSIDNLISLGRVTVSARIDNLFDQKYESSGYGGNYAYEDSGSVIVGGWAEYFPAAERSFYGQVQLELF